MCTVYSNITDNLWLHDYTNSTPPEMKRYVSTGEGWVTP